MGNQVRNAVNTQKQFQAQPRPVFEKNLKGLAPNTQVDVALSDNTRQLAQSLGVLGDTINKGTTQHEKRKEKIGIAEAERVVAMQDEEAFRTLRAVDALSTYSDFKVSDNPYALVTYEKMRGKYFSSIAKNEYDTWRLEQPEAPKTAEDENKQFSNFMQERYGDVVNISSNMEAFRTGFFDNYTVDQAKVNQTWHDEKAKDILEMRKGTTFAELGKLAEQGYSLTTEELVKGFNTTLASSTLTHAPNHERMDYAKEFAKQFILMTGDYKKLEEIAKEAVLGVDPQGTPILMIDKVDLSPYKRQGEIRSSQIEDEKKQEWSKNLEGKPNAEVNAAYERLKVEDPSFYNQVASRQGSIIKNNEVAQKKKELANLKSGADQWAEEQLQSIIRNDYFAHRDNREGVNGRTRASKREDLKVTYKTVDSQGNVIEKTRTATDAEVEREFNKIYDEILQSDLSDSEKAQKLLNLYQWESASHMRAVFKNSVLSSLDSLDATNPTLSNHTQKAVEMYKSDPNVFARLFDNQTTAQISALTLISNNVGGDLNEGARKYAEGRDRLKLQGVEKEINSALDAQLPMSGSLKDFRALDGDSKNLPITGNESVYLSVKETAKHLMAAHPNMKAKEAINLAISESRKYLAVYKDTAMPIAVFNDIQAMPEDKAEVGKMALDRMVTNYAWQKGILVSDVYCEWDSTREVMNIKGGGASISRDINDITWEGNNILSEEAKKKPEERSVKLRDVQKGTYQTYSDEDGNPLFGNNEQFGNTD